jgi:hypothetical protein
MQKWAGDGAAGPRDREDEPHALKLTDTSLLKQQYSNTTSCDRSIDGGG